MWETGKRISWPPDSTTAQSGAVLPVAWAQLPLFCFVDLVTSWFYYGTVRRCIASSMGLATTVLLCWLVVLGTFPRIVYSKMACMSWTCYAWWGKISLTTAGWWRKVISLLISYVTLSRTPQGTSLYLPGSCSILLHSFPVPSFICCRGHPGCPLVLKFFVFPDLCWAGDKAIYSDILNNPTHIWFPWVDVTPSSWDSGWSCL